MKNSDLIDSNLTTRRVQLVPSEVVYVKGIVDASLGVGAIFAERGGVLTVVAPHSRAKELDELLGDLQAELGARMSTEASPDGGSNGMRLDEAHEAQLGEAQECDPGAEVE